MCELPAVNCSPNPRHILTYRPLTHRALQWLADNLSLPPVATGIVCTTLLGGFALDHEPVLFPRNLANWVGAVGSFAMCLLFLDIANNPLSLLTPWIWPAVFAFPFVGLVFLGWFNFRFMFLLVWMALAISRTAKQISHLDLLDTSAVKPYAQQGVRTSLLAVISLSISSNLWLDPNSPVIATGTTVVLLIMATVLALLLPAWGIHMRIKVSKQSRLKQIRRAIALRRDPDTRSVDKSGEA